MVLVVKLALKLKVEHQMIIVALIRRARYNVFPIVRRRNACTQCGAQRRLAMPLVIRKANSNKIVWSTIRHYANSHWFNNWHVLVLDATIQIEVRQ